MTHSIDINPNRRVSAKLAAGLAISACLVFGTFAVSASAAEHGHRGGGHHQIAERGHGGGYHGGGHYGGGWGGGYYAAPPVVYGSPYYEPPPVVYGPGIGIALPGVGISIQ